MKLGKTPARTNAVSFKLAKYIDKTALPTPPAQFGHENLVGEKAWAMLGNDHYGDCVWAGAAHETMLWNLERDKSVAFDDKHVLSDYSKVTGFDPAKPDTDQGTDMQVAATYRRKTGVIDEAGKRHKVAAYLAITPGDVQEHLLALYLFGVVGLGIEFPASAMDQFNEGKPWDVVPKAKIEGGHYIPLVAKRDNFDVVTWGQLQQMTPEFLAKYNDESVVYVSREMLTGGKSLEGFDLAQLKADLAALGH
jgi:hypothetical protein